MTIVTVKLREETKGACSAVRTNPLPKRKLRCMESTGRSIMLTQRWGGGGGGTRLVGCARITTKNIACAKFARKLDFTWQRGRTLGSCHPVFWFLKFDGRSFHHRPKPADYEGPTRNNEYYWCPDLETEALSHGWEPRGKEKEEVPWVRKDLSNRRSLVAVKKQAPSTITKRKAQDVVKTSDIVMPEKRKRGRKS